MRIIVSILGFLFFVGCNHARNAPAKRIETTSANKEIKPMDRNLEIATFGGGCYWCMEAVFQRLNGVEKVESGFSGGKVKNPTYKEAVPAPPDMRKLFKYHSTPKVSTDILKVFFYHARSNDIKPAG
ncbi:MAG: peptide-methionine (S)-S-oxide reductase [Chitinophagales bacterium]